MVNMVCYCQVIGIQKNMFILDNKYFRWLVDKERLGTFCKVELILKQFETYNLPCTH